MYKDKMAKFGEVAAPVAPPKAAYTVDLQHFMENVQELNYPIEVYKDGYYRVIMAHREHWQALRDGWSEEREFGMDYKPLSAHPDNVKKAAQQAETLRAKQAHDKAMAEGNGMVKMADVQAMISAALNQKPSSFAPQIQTEE